MAEPSGKILTLHPAGRAGRRIDADKYETLRKAIVAALADGELTHAELFDRLECGLGGRFDGNVGWYGETVKLDLEARKVIERTGGRPQKYRLIAG